MQPRGQSFSHSGNIHDVTNGLQNCLEVVLLGLAAHLSRIKSTRTNAVTATATQRQQARHTTHGHTTYDDVEALIHTQLAVDAVCVVLRGVQQQTDCAARAHRRFRTALRFKSRVCQRLARLVQHLHHLSTAHSCCAVACTHLSRHILANITALTAPASCRRCFAKGQQEHDVVLTQRVPLLPDLRRHTVKLQIHFSADLHGNITAQLRLGHEIHPEPGDGSCHAGPALEFTLLHASARAVVERALGLQPCHCVADVFTHLVR